MSQCTIKLIAALVACTLTGLTARVSATPLTTSVGTFTGGDVGEGLDLDGDFAFAVNARGPAGAVVRDVTFTNDSTPGVNLIAENDILNWAGAQPDYGSTSNDDNLEGVMNSIRWTATGNGGIEEVRVQLSGLGAGNVYQLQMLIMDNDGNRGWDIFADDALIVNDFEAIAAGTTLGQVVSHVFVADTSTFDFSFSGVTFNGLSSDTNPILQGFTLELVSQVPEPNTATAAGWGLLAVCTAARRRRRKGLGAV